MDSFAGFSISVFNHEALIIPAQQTAEFKKLLSSLLIQRHNQRDVYELTHDDVVPGRDSKRERLLINAGSFVLFTLNQYHLSRLELPPDPMALMRWNILTEPLSQVHAINFAPFWEDVVLL